MNKRFLSAVLFGALLASSTGTFTSCKDYDDDINGLQEQIDANKKTLDEKSAALQTALDAANQEITAAKAAAAAAQAAADAAKTSADKAAQDAAAAQQAAAAAQEAAATAKAEAIAEAQRLVNELKAVVEGKVDQSVYDAKMEAVDAQLNVINGKLEGLAEANLALATQIKALEDFKTAIDGLNLTTALPGLVEKIDAIRTELTDLRTQVGLNTADIDDVKSKMSTVSDKVDGINLQLNTMTALLSNRLTALTFAPTQFVNGIEVINFATLQYTPWTVLTADAPTGNEIVSINDGKTTATYYASPSSVKKANIKSLTVLTGDATNKITRAAGDVDIVASISQEIAAGKMIVNLKKNSLGSLNKPNTADGDEAFTMLALRADIELTADEVAKGIQPQVISDWARLVETAVTPYIHNKAYTTDVAEDIDNDVIPHFYKYSTIHDAASGAVSSTEGKYIVAKVSYMDKTFDLNKLVDICDKDGHRYVAADYNLAFEFNLVDYYLQAQNEEKTNQKLFAKITNGVITSQARNGQVENRDAIGREPLVQIVLRDTKNDKVVDVRYLKIKWIGESGNESLGTLGDYTDDFNASKCGETYSNIVGEEAMNGVYAKLNVKKEEFHALYALDTNVYATEEDAAEGKNAVVGNLGDISEVSAPGSTMTGNLQWDLAIAENPITAAEYIAGKATRTIYGKYYSILSPELTYTFKLVLTLNVTQMAFDAGYNATYWSANAVNSNKDKIFMVNPALTSDAIYGITNFFDCQIIADMLTGYNKTTGITTVLDLVKNAQVADFVFDADRLVGTRWTVSTDGKSLSTGGVVAATIDGGVIRLAENPVPTVSAHGAPTTAAQLLLGETVPVKLVAKYCNGKLGDASLTANLDYFQVKFINPLAMTLANVTESFKDMITGGSDINISRIATIKETFGLERTVWANGAAANAQLGQWYNVQNVTWNLNGAKTNLKIQGNNIIITDNPTESNWSDFTDKYVLSALPSMVNATTLKFENNSGAALQQPIKIAVPVYATTKWAPQLFDANNQYVILTVSPDGSAQ